MTYIYILVNKKKKGNFFICLFFLQIFFKIIFRYICTCLKGYVDASPNITHYPGRICHKPKHEKLNDDDGLTKSSLITCTPKESKCGTNEACTDRKARGKFVCDCAENAFRFTDNTCRCKFFFFSLYFNKILKKLSN